MGVVILGSKCTMTTQNKVERKIVLKNMLICAWSTHSVSALYLCIIWIFEYFCQYHFIDTDDDATWSTLQRVIKQSECPMSLLGNLNTWRNELCHLNTIHIINILKYASHYDLDDIEKMCYVFEEDADWFAENIYYVFNCEYDFTLFNDGATIKEPAKADSF